MDYIFIGGRRVIFYKERLVEIDGVIVPGEILTDIWTDVPIEGIAKEGGVDFSRAKKPEALIKRIVELATEDGDIVLDFFAGSGTTAAVAHKMGRRYIGVEQMDYIETITVERLKKVIAGEQGGISKTVNWQGGDSFVYCELAEWNAMLVKEILTVSNKKGIAAMVNKLKTMPWRAFINYTASPEFVFDETKTNEQGKRFSDLPVEEQKELLVALLDKNFLYVNLTELDAPEMGFDETTQNFNRSFYSMTK
jgi:adenine-specific DNA-methyltransferase